MALISRQFMGDNCYTNGFGQVRCYNSAWNNWVRWLVLGLIILFALFIFFLFSCLSARRRRQSGYQPYRGTGWVLGRTPPGHGAAQYNQNAYPRQEQSYQPYYNNSNNPPPAYGAANDYYGNSYRNDMELQSPPAAYAGNKPQYAPPTGPPPNGY